ncbi:MAG TPA: penicillin-binding transpeptidase domain-containing protein [Gemmatimonadales bacterium]|nr:penicillin-binding transpeptidase domain-containing protein [Gemmatimonadales bacterium]
MAKPAVRTGFIQFCLGLGMLSILARAAQLQLVRGDEFAERAARQRTTTVVMPARRGTIYDRSGEPLVVSQEQYHLSIAPEQVRDPRATARVVGRALGEAPAGLARELASGRLSVYRHGPYTASQVQPLRDVAGVHLEPLQRRLRYGGDFAAPMLGVFDPEAEIGKSGIESALDSLLRGTPGEAVVLRDIGGQRFESPSRLVSHPVPGHDVYLTIDARLQEIAERALDEALVQMDARAGDIVFLDPNSGELLAVASRQEGERPSSAAFSAPFEPGSTVKLFTAAALLREDRVDSTDTVSAENGTWRIDPPLAVPYTITDEHVSEEPLTLAHAVEVSSNIGMAKFARRLEPRELYAALRDFGFGTYTGVVPAGAESRGSLPMPAAWEPELTLESLSRGYSFSVTAVQLASAYAVIANGGTLYAPTLVKRIEAPGGRVVYRHDPEPVRRVIPVEVAQTLRRYLRGAVGEAGTGELGQIQNYELIGKTGTAQVARGGSYVPGEYTASFASIWPADDPQLVAVVKIDNPSEGSYFGGLTAAPLTREILEEALASRNDALQLNRLASTGVVRLPDPPAPPPEPPVIVGLPWPQRATDSTPSRPVVPEVGGRGVRAAVALLHQNGLRVRLRGRGGSALRTSPEAGRQVARGSTVELLLGNADD